MHLDRRENGHAAPNLFLQAGTPDLESVVVGTFVDPATTAMLHRTVRGRQPGVAREPASEHGQQ